MQSFINKIVTTVPGLYRHNGLIYLMIREHVGTCVSMSRKEFGKTSIKLPEFGPAMEFLPTTQKVQLRNGKGPYDFPFLCRNSRINVVFLMQDYHKGVVVNGPDASKFGEVWNITDFPQRFYPADIWQPLDDSEVVCLSN